MQWSPASVVDCRFSSLPRLDCVPWMGATRPNYKSLGLLASNWQRSTTSSNLIMFVAMLGFKTWKKQSLPLICLV
eukprot:5637686-Amphidinium_carterae.1